MIETLLTILFIIVGFSLKDPQYFIAAGVFATAANIDQLSDYFRRNKENETEEH